MVLSKKLTDALFFDIGAQIGQYTMFVAKLGRKVVSVEPFIDNIYRIHKAIRQESLQDNVILIQNAISNKRNEIKALNPSANNIGAQSLMPQMHLTYERNETNKYLVETILLDDLVPFLPKNFDGSDFKKAIMKIDIEGFEAFAFQQASKLFDQLNFLFVFMEFRAMKAKKTSNEIRMRTQAMLDFFVARKFAPIGVGGNYLKINMWHDWPEDMVWVKDMQNY